LEEVKIVLHIFWKLFRMKGTPRYVTGKELEMENPLGENNPENIKPSLSISDALTQANKHGIILQLQIENRESKDILYMINNSEGKKALDYLTSHPPKERATITTGALPKDIPNIFTLYENTIGSITNTIVDDLKEAESKFPEDWITEAFHIAAQMNARNWRYIASILDRWAKEGKDIGTSGRSTPQEVGRYIKGTRGPLVPWR
jgi:DnaD/phage-associated family protein